MQAHPGGPSSALFEIRDTPSAGRAVFAKRRIPAESVIWRSEDLSLFVLLREYRREVCGQCFGYDDGRDLCIRDQSVGFAFCSRDCQDKWRQENGHVGTQAWEAVEKLVKGRSKEDSEMVDAALPRPQPKEITTAWERVSAQAAMIRIARQEERSLSLSDTKVNGEVHVTKQHRKALQKALLQRISPDVMSFCVTGILWKYNKPHEWESVLDLAIDNTPYPNSDDLVAHTRTYLHLLSILPLPLLPLITPENLFLLSSRDSHNSFGIRSLEDDGSEFFGYGCWPAASYFNHSCGPNIEKRRLGRMWEFRASSDIEEGGEMCITYLSGEERKMSRDKRMHLLKRNWGFDCCCKRCGIV